MSKIFPFQVVLAATAIAIPLAQKATATESNVEIDYVNLWTLKTEEGNPTWKKQSMSIPSVLDDRLEERRETQSERSQENQKIYRVQSGDTLIAIAQSQSVNLENLIEVNQLSNPNYLEVGQKLLIPFSKANLFGGRSANATSDKKRIAPKNFLQATHPVSPIATEKISVVAMTTLGTVGERNYPTVDQISTEQWLQKYSGSQAISKLATPIQNQPKSTAPKKFSPSHRSSLVGTASFNRQDDIIIRKRDRETVAPELPPLSTPDSYLPNYPAEFSGYIYPAKGTLTSGYGWRWGRMHKGIDIAAPIGTPVVAAAAGKVVWAGWNKDGYGNLVKIQHADKSVTLYAHNSRVLVYPGQTVQQGEQIAQIGSTGYSTGPHLHFEIHRGGQKAVNPMAYLPRSE